MVDKDNTEAFRNKLRKRGIAVASGAYYTLPDGRGYPVEICEKCGCIVDLTLWDKHKEICSNFNETPCIN